mmetsp:Transcript_62118/g.148148  ORF Transcript_62118/g.148148 Transcript_62118/m.148148 type:complete len:215 (+) Transcript_62118:63-707(+)
MLAASRTRAPLKVWGRSKATDDLRERCLARVRETRAERLHVLRTVAGSPVLDLQDTVREAMELELQDSCMACDSSDLDIDQLLELERSLVADIEREEAELRAAEFEESEALELEAICELYEQHMLPGVVCPLCCKGRLDLHNGDLRCTECIQMKVALMDEEMCLDDVSERLWTAEKQHRHTGCNARANFEVAEVGGAATLLHTCTACGWEEIAL